MLPHCCASGAWCTCRGAGSRRSFSRLTVAKPDRWRWSGVSSKRTGRPPRPQGGAQRGWRPLRAGQASRPQGGARDGGYSGSEPRGAYMLATTARGQAPRSQGGAVPGAPIYRALCSGRFEARWDQKRTKSNGRSWTHPDGRPPRFSEGKLDGQPLARVGTKSACAASIPATSTPHLPKSTQLSGRL